MAVVTMKELLARRRPLRASDPPLEPEDEAIHLHRAQRHLHHRPAAVADLHRPRVRVRQGDRRPRRHGAVRRHQEAGAGSDRRAGHPRRHALRQPALARRHAHQLPDRLQAAAAPQGARGDRADVARATASCTKKEALILQREKDKLRTHPRRHPRDDAGARARCGSSTPRRSTSPSARPASSASRSSRSSTPTATPTRSTTRSRATTTRSARSTLLTRVVADAVAEGLMARAAAARRRREARATPARARRRRAAAPTGSASCSVRECGSC